jgi:hypothetical protein
MNKSIFHSVIHACTAALIVAYMLSLAEVRQDYREAISAVRGARALVIQAAEVCGNSIMKEQ